MQSKLISIVAITLAISRNVDADCVVAGETVDDGSVMHFLEGEEENVEGSIYAKCSGTTATCYIYQSEVAGSFTELETECPNATTEGGAGTFSVENTCDVLGITLTNYQTKYFGEGKAGIAGSIYARCVNGVANCYEDDGILGRADSEPVDCSVTTRRLGIAQGGSTAKYWPENVMCIKLDQETYDFTQEEIDTIRAAREDFHSNTNVRLMWHSNCLASEDKADLCGGSCEHYVDITNDDDGCYSSVGYQEGVQPLNLNFNCLTKRTATQAFGHALGLWNEQNHPERDAIVLRDQIPEAPANYIKRDVEESLTSDYDTGSVMHDTEGLCMPSSDYTDVIFCDITQNEDDGCTIPLEEHCADPADPAEETENALNQMIDSLSGSDKAILDQMYPALEAAS